MAFVFLRRSRRKQTLQDGAVVPGDVARAASACLPTSPNAARQLALDLTVCGATSCADFLGTSVAEAKQARPP